MPNEDEKKTGAEGDADTGDTKQPAKPQDSGKGDDGTVPLAKMLEYKKQAKEANEKIAKFEADAKAKTEADLVASGEFKTLSETKTAELLEAQAKIDSLTGELGKLTEGVKDTETKFLESIKDETDKAIITASLLGKSLAEKAVLLPTLEKRFGTPDYINSNKVKGGGDKPPVTAIKVEELNKKIEEATKAGKTAEVLSLISERQRLDVK